MTRPEIQALYNRLLASPSEDGVNILADAFQRAQVDAARAERERIATRFDLSRHPLGGMAGVIRSEEFNP